MPTSERRKYPRVAINSELAPLDDGQFSYLANLSHGGALLHTPLSFADRAEIRLNCSVILDDVLILGSRARVVRHDPENHALGLEFLEPTPELRAMIDRVLAFQNARPRLQAGDVTAVAEWQSFQEPPRVRPLFDESALKGSTLAASSRPARSSGKPANPGALLGQQHTPTPAPIPTIEQIPHGTTASSDYRETLESIPAVASGTPAFIPVSQAAPAAQVATQSSKAAESAPILAKRPRRASENRETAEAHETGRAEEEVTRVFYYSGADPSATSQSQMIYDDLQDSEEADYERQRARERDEAQSAETATSHAKPIADEPRIENSGASNLPLPRPEDDYI